MKLSIIIPAYNEERTIQTVIDNVLAVKLPNDMTKEIIIVDDGSSDSTYELLKPFINNPLFKIFRLENNQGKTSGIKTGIKNATGDILLIQDADLEYHPNEYPKLLAPILSGETSVVYGSRFKGQIADMKLINRTANVTSNIVFNILYGTKITDINTCYKVFTRDAIVPIEIESEHFAFETEVTTKLIRRGYNIVEVPIDYTARTLEAGKKINWSKALNMFWGMFKYRYSKK